MVRNGQLDTATAITEFGFSNPDHPRVGIEVLRLTELTSRLSTSVLAAVHRTDFHQIFLSTAGSGVMMIDFVDYPCVPGTLFQVSPGRVLRLPHPSGPGDALEALVVLFTPAFAPALDATRKLLSPFGPVASPLDPSNRDSMGRTATELLTEYDRLLHEPHEDQALEVSVALVRQLLGVLLLRIARLPVSAASPVIHGIRQEVFERFQHELERSFATTRNAADYAARLGYSLRSVNRACAAATGHTAKALIDARVALEAKRLLTHTDLPVAMIGRRLGFSEPTNFGKFFSRETGNSPGEFRAREGA